jgi:hypothetical protein
VRVIESQDTQTEATEEICTKRDDTPEGQDRDDVVLDLRGQNAGDRRVRGQERQREQEVRLDVLSVEGTVEDEGSYLKVYAEGRPVGGAPWD